MVSIMKDASKGGVPIRASVGESCKSLYLFKSFCHLECAYVVWLVWDNFKDLLSLLQFQHMLTDDTMCSDDPHTVFSRQPLIERGFSSIKHWLSTSSMAKARLLGCWKFIAGWTENSSLQVILIILYISKKNQLNDMWLAATTWPPCLLDLRIKMEDIPTLRSDVLIRGLYPSTKAKLEWDYSLHGPTLELAVPVMQANWLLRCIRELLNEAAAQGKQVTSMYQRWVLTLVPQTYQLW